VAGGEFALVDDVQQVVNHVALELFHHLLVALDWANLCDLIDLPKARVVRERCRQRDDLLAGAQVIEQGWASLNLLLAGSCRPGKSG
jgi:hypothetical protein